MAEGRLKDVYESTRHGLGVATFIALFLGIPSHQLTLRYPTGLLQEFITLPWPLHWELET